MVKSFSSYRWLTPLLAIILVAGLAGSATSSLFQKKDRIHISGLHQIDDDYYAITEHFRLDGVIDGDLILFAASANITGTITRSATIMGRDIDHSGMIKGSLRTGGQNIDIGGSVMGSVIAAGMIIQVKQEAIIERDLNAYGAEVDIAGSVKGNLVAEGEKIIITGTISGDVDLTGDRIDIIPPAVIEGSFTYKSKKEANIDTDGVTILGDIKWDEKVEKDCEGSECSSPASRLAWALAGFLFGVVLIRIFRRHTEAAICQLRTRPSVSIAAGLLGVLIVGAFSILLLVSAVATIGGQTLIAAGSAAIGSLLLAFSLFFLLISSLGSVIGGVLYCSGSLVVGLFIGLTVLKYVKPDIKAYSIAAMFLGVIVMALLFAIPYLGPILVVIASLLGAGAIILGMRDCRAPGENQKPPEAQ